MTSVPYIVTSSDGANGRYDGQGSVTSDMYVTESRDDKHSIGTLWQRPEGILDTTHYA